MSKPESLWGDSDQEGLRRLEGVGAADNAGVQRCASAPGRPCFHIFLYSFRAWFVVCFVFEFKMQGLE